jgi:hypothetical protein
LGAFVFFVGFEGLALFLGGFSVLGIYTSTLRRYRLRLPNAESLIHGGRFKFSPP